MINIFWKLSASPFIDHLLKMTKTMVSDSILSLFLKSGTESLFKLKD